MIAALALAALQAHSPTPDDFQARVARCGIAAERVTARFEPELQLDVVFIGGGGAPSDETLTCVAEASAETGRIARFTDPDADTRFGDAWSNALDRRARALAREWLRERGRLEALPRFDPQRQSLAGFAGRLETFCGVAAGTVLRVEAGMLTFTGAEALSRLAAEQTECLLHAAVAGDAGFSVGFVGNEVYDRGDEER